MPSPARIHEKAREGEVAVYKPTGQICGVLRSRKGWYRITMGSAGPQYSVRSNQVRKAFPDEENIWNGTSGKRPGRPKKEKKDVETL